MKSLSIFILYLLAATSVLAQNKTSIASYTLHGHVKILREKSSDIAHGDTTLMADDEILFGRSGKVQRIIHHQPFNVASEDYRYDNNGRLQQLIQYVTGGKIFLTMAYSYGSDDSTYMITATTPEGRVYQKTQFGHGKILGFEKYYGPDTSKNDWSVFTYDQAGRITSEVVFYHRKPSYRHGYGYPGSGKDNIDTFYNKDNKVSYTEQRFYDKQGRIVHSIAHMPGGRFLVERFMTYDTHGNRINNREIDNVMNLNWDTQYTYDRHDNWTVRHTKPVSKKGSETYVVREISYY